MMTEKSKKGLFFLLKMLIAFALAGIDQIIKHFATQDLRGKESIVLVKNFLALTYAENTGAAFSFMNNSTTLLSILTLVLLVFLVGYMFVGKIETKATNVCLVMIIAGGTGNLIDRFLNGYVVDYIETLFIEFPIFNFADILITCGAFAFCGILTYEIIKEEKAKKMALKNSDGDN